MLGEMPPTLRVNGRPTLLAEALELAARCGARPLAARAREELNAAGLELPEHWFHGAGAELVVVAAAGMAQAPGGAGGGRKPVQVPGPLRGALAAPGGVFGQRREQPQAVGVGAGEVLLADIPGVSQHGVIATAACTRKRRC
jgi:hypothetical protein